MTDQSSTAQKQVAAICRFCGAVEGVASHAGGCADTWRVTAEFAHAKAIAAEFHRVYEELAPQFGYETRRESAVAWEDVPEQNKRLMIATIGGLLHVGVITAGQVITDGT